MSNKTLKITPLLNRLLIKPIEGETENELIIPDSAKEKPQKGIVMAVGPGKEGQPMESKVGDITYYKRNAGTPFPGTDGWLMMTEGVDTIAILSNEGDTNFNISSAQDAIGHRAPVGGIEGCDYAGPYAVFTLSASSYTDNGQTSKVYAKDLIFIYAEWEWVEVLKKDASVDFAHILYVKPVRQDYTIKITANSPLIVHPEAF